MADSNEQQTEAGTLNVVPGEITVVSECCLASATNHVVEIDSPEGCDWRSSHFVCDECGEECRVETNPRVIELRRQIATDEDPRMVALREQIAGEEAAAINEQETSE